MAKKKVKLKSDVKLPQFKLTELAYSLRVITSNYEEWCNMPLPTQYPD